MSKQIEELKEKINCYQLAIESKQCEIKSLESHIEKAQNNIALIECGSDAVYIYCCEKDAFYRPKAQGYTLYKNLAGVFTLKDGEAHLRSVGKEKRLKLIRVKD